LSGAWRQDDRRGENSSKSERRGTSYRLHQSGRDHKCAFREGNSIGIESERQGQRAGAGAAGTGGDVLRHRTSIVYAGLATGGVALPAGRSAVAVWSAGGAKGDG